MSEFVTLHFIISGETEDGLLLLTPTETEGTGEAEEEKDESSECITWHNKDGVWYCSDGRQVPYR